METPILLNYAATLFWSRMFYKQNVFIKSYLQILTLLFILPLYSQAEERALLDLDLQSLMKIQITSAGRKEQNIADVPAAVYVIDQKDIEKSGATSIPELLRVVPGLQVARISSSKWAISSRGFNGIFANKLLVQIDGRSVYTPSDGGVYWDVQNVILEDIDRIEVIRGPGATLWGANAVNGVINIITRQASDTQGTLISVGAGNQEQGMETYRYGTKLNENSYGRFYISRHDQSPFQFSADKTDAHDEWQMVNSGFRLDGDVGAEDGWTVQGDLYHGENSQRIDTLWTPYPPYLNQVDDVVNSAGGNLLARWQRRFSDKNSWTLQAYYDFTDRDEIYLGQTMHTFDIDFQNRLQLNDRHDMVWGIGYRLNQDHFNNTYQIELTPDSRTDRTLSTFLQDEITLFEEILWLTAGSKFEYNECTGYEVQPNLRLLWKPEKRHSIWTSVARAIRTPFRHEDSGRVTTLIIHEPTFSNISIFGSPDFDAEHMVAYEMGYRYGSASNFSIDTAIYYNRYRDLQSYYQESELSQIYFVNGMAGRSYGLEITAAWTPKDWINTELSYSCIEIRMDAQNDQNFYVEETAEGSTPQHQISLMANMSLGHNLYLNLGGSYTGELKAAGTMAAQHRIVVDDYFNLNANIKWRLNKELEIALVGENLLESSHLEFIQEYFTSPIEIKRSFYTKLTWKF